MILYAQCKGCGHQQDADLVKCDNCGSTDLEKVEENSTTARLMTELKGLMP